MPRLAALMGVLLLAASAPAALAQEPLAPDFAPTTQAPPPAATPTPDPATEAANEETDRTLLFAIGGALIVLFVVIGRVITRDARKALHEVGHDEAPRQRDQGPHRHARQAKAKARAKTKAQRRARRSNR
jgi:hypothetical protein